jgi:hypothetical protein
MAIYGSCERGCSEQRLDLVGADAFDELVAAGARSRAAVTTFGGVADELAQGRPPQRSSEAEYRRIQKSARAALRAHPEDTSAADEEVPTATAWWCPACDGLGAPQPCLGICVWRLVDWVRAEDYEREHERVDALLVAEAALRRLLRQVRSVTPREGRWEAAWQAFSAGARQTLESLVQPDPGSPR